jgi:hypothetical protein
MNCWQDCKRLIELNSNGNDNGFLPRIEEISRIRKKTFLRNNN